MDISKPSAECFLSCIVRMTAYETETTGHFTKKLMSHWFAPADALGSTRLVWKHVVTSATFSVATYALCGTPVSASGTKKMGSRSLQDARCVTDPPQTLREGYELAGMKADTC